MKSDTNHARAIRQFEENFEYLQRAFTHDEAKETLVIHFRDRNEYHVPLRRIKTPQDLLGWVCHLCVKTWMKVALLRAFISEVCSIKGWELHKQV